MPKRKPPKGSDIPEWVVTYGDLMSLLLCFFILIVAFSEPKKPEEFRKVLQKIQEALGFKGGIGVNDIEIQSANAEITIKTQQVNRGDEGRFSSDAPTRNVSGVAEKATIVQEGELQVIGGALQFAGGSAELTEDVKHELRENIAGQIRDRRYIIEIVGHSSGTADLTMGGHWEASFRRAQAARDYLVDECGVDPMLLRLELAGNLEPAPVEGGKNAGSNRRVQVYMTGKTLDQVSPDPYGTGRP